MILLVCMIILYITHYLGLRSGGPKHVTVGISSFVGFCSGSAPPWAEAEVNMGVLCSFFGGGWGDELWPWKPRLRFGERQRRRALNCLSSSPRRLPKEVRRTGLLRLGSRRLRWERVAGERWKESSELSPVVSTMEESLVSCKTANVELVCINMYKSHDYIIMSVSEMRKKF